MPDTPYKTTIPPPSQHAEQAALALSWPKPFVRAPWAGAMLSQDTSFNGRRILLAHHNGGSGEWQVGNVSVGDAEVSQTYPEVDTWRTVMESRATLGPGSVLELRALFVPSGLAQREVPTNVWDPVLGGTVRLVVGYDNGTDTDTATVELTTIKASAEADGFELVTYGAVWPQIQHIYRPGIQPLAAVAADEWAKWSEWATVDMSLDFKGGIRCIAVNVSEVPKAHAVLHTAESTLHDAATVPPMEFAATKGADGVTYDEPRHGTFRALDVAARQEKRNGPRLFSFGSHSEEGAEVTDVDPDPFEFSATTFESLIDGSAAEGWSADAAGWDIPAAYCRCTPTNLATRLYDNAAAIPVRLRLHARFTTDAATEVGTFRVATSARSWVDFTIPEESTWTEYTITTYLEANMTTRDSAAIVQCFGKVTGGTMQVRYGSGEFGEFTVEG